MQCLFFLVFYVESVAITHIQRVDLKSPKWIYLAFTFATVNESQILPSGIATQWDYATT